MEEMIDYVDENDLVIGNCSRSEVKSMKKNHRVVHIYIFNSKNELLICKRPKEINYPNMWTSSAGGHVNSGEGYESAAYRELKEELGIEVSLKKMNKIKSFYPSGHFVFIELWEGRCDNGFKFDPKEIIKHKFLPVKLVKELIHKNKKQFVPHFIEILERY